MINIYLCEDDQVQLECWKNRIEKYLMIHNMDMELFCWTKDPLVLLTFLEKSECVGLYFIDIDLNADMNGLELAVKIRKHDPRGYIVFITTHDEMAPLTFKLKVEAMDFILKDEPDQFEKKICSCLEAAHTNYYRHLQAGNRALVIKDGPDSILMNQDDILFITCGHNSHTIVIYTWNGVRRLSGTLKEIKTRLNRYFCYCSRSAIINIKNMEIYLPGERKVQMKNGAFCDVSFRMAGEIQRRIKELG